MSDLTFADLGLDAAILQSLTESGYENPTPIQKEAVPSLLTGRDILASAQTGTGKTAAFMLPALQKLTTKSESASRGPRVLVLTPTRELAQQVTDATQRYGKHIRHARTVSIVGGVSYMTQNKLLARAVDILVATPGRLIDHLERGRIDFSRLEMLVLDEADRMLDMGFIDDVERIAAALPTERQTALFSATLDGVIGDLARRITKDPVTIQIATAQSRHENIDQRIHYVDNLEHKNRVLQHLLADAEVNQAIVFTATKRDADELAGSLSEEGQPVAALHGDMTQRERNRTLLKMRQGQVRVLIATDVAARGIDVAGITHVINYDLPRTPEDYVHRIGRTGRAGASGKAISLVSPRDGFALKNIQRLIGTRIHADIIPGLEPKQKPRTEGRPQRRDFDRPRREFDGNRESRPFGGERRFDNRNDAPRSFDRPRFDDRGPRREFDGNRESRPFGGDRRPEGRSFDKPRFDRPRRDFDAQPQGLQFEERQPKLTLHELGDRPAKRGFAGDTRRQDGWQSFNRGSDDRRFSDNRPAKRAVGKKFSPSPRDLEE